MEVEWSTSCLGRLTPGKEPRYQLQKRLGGPQSRSGRFGENSFAFAGNRTPTPQPFSPQPRHRTDQTILGLQVMIHNNCPNQLTISWQRNSSTLYNMKIININHEQRLIFETNWIGHILRRNCLLKERDWRKVRGNDINDGKTRKKT